MSKSDLLLQSLFGHDDDDDSEDDDSVSSHDCPRDQKTDTNSLPEIEKRSNTTRTTAVKPPIPKDIDKQIHHQPLQKEAGEKRKRESISLSPPPQSTNPDTINNWRQRIQVFDNVLTRGECDELIAIHHSEPHAGYIHGLKVTRIIDLVLGGQLDNDDNDDASLSIPLVLPLLQARYRVWEIVETKAFPELELEILPEYTSLTSWHAGSVLKPHYDSNKEYLKDRHYSALLYLNDPMSPQDEKEPSSNNGGSKHLHPKNYHKNGFSGGDLVFEVPPHVLDANNNNNKDSANHSKNNNTIDDKQVRIRPRAGRLVCFPASKDYVHGVETITSGTRYALTMWFTKHAQALESLESVQNIQVARVKNRYSNNVARFVAPGGLLRNHQQPWETPEQAEALRLQILADAGLPKLPQQQHKEQHPPTLLAKSKFVELSESQVVHLIAFCWWKQGRPLADLVESAVLLHAPDDVQYIMQQSDAALVAAQPSSTLSQRQLWRFEWKEDNNETKDTNFGYFFHHQWQTLYLSSRSRGLASALHRWKQEGMITSVHNNEMKI